MHLPVWGWASRSLEAAVAAAETKPSAVLNADDDSTPRTNQPAAIATDVRIFLPAATLRSILAPLPLPPTQCKDMGGVEDVLLGFSSRWSSSADTRVLGYV